MLFIKILFCIIHDIFRSHLSPNKLVKRSHFKIIAVSEPGTQPLSHEINLFIRVFTVRIDLITGVIQGHDYFVMGVRPTVSSTRQVEVTVIITFLFMTFYKEYNLTDTDFVQII